MKSKDAFALGLGITQGSFFNADSTLDTTNSGYPTVTVHIVNQTVEGDANVSIPVAFPFGLIGLPAPNLYATTMNFQAGIISPVVTGQIAAYANEYVISGLSAGEYAFYSYNHASTTGYSLQANLNGLHAKLKNTLGNNTATMLYGENIVKTLVDIITYLDSLSTWLTGFQTAYNSGTVPYSPTIPSISTIDADKTGLQAGKGYINNNGEPL